MGALLTRAVNNRFRQKRPAWGGCCAYYSVFSLGPFAPDRHSGGSRLFFGAKDAVREVP